MKTKKGSKDVEDSEDSDVDDLDDEEVSLGSMDEEDFGDELEEEGGMFMEANEGGDDEDEGRLCRTNDVTSCLMVLGFVTAKKLKMLTYVWSRDLRLKWINVPSLFQFQNWMMMMMVSTNLHPVASGVVTEIFKI